MEPQVSSAVVGRTVLVLVLLAVIVGAWQVLSPQTAPWHVAAGGTATDAGGWTVVQVIDGDTLDLRRGEVTERVRLIAVDAPERVRCGYAEARDALAELVGTGPVWLVTGSPDGRDQYGRLLRYVEVDAAGGRIDAGRHLLDQGLAVAVFDSRRGYPRHDREDAYIAADEAADDVCPDMRDR